MPHGITQCYLPPGRGDIPALLVTTVRCAKTAEPIEMLWTQVGPRNRALDHGPDPPGDWAILWIVLPHCNSQSAENSDILA